MTDHPLHSKPLYAQLADLIENKIIAGEYRLGDQLPTEFDLAAQYRVSRTVVREAMKALKEKGWVDTRVGRGTFIVDNVARNIGSSFDVMVRMNPEFGFEHLIEIRQMIEPEIAALAAVRASEEQIQAMHAAVEQMDTALAIEDGMDQFLEADYEFHQRIAESTGNPLILSIIQPVVSLMREQQKYHLYKVAGGGMKSQANHRMIMQAIEEHDSKAARKHMLDHIRQVREDVRNYS